MCNATRIVNANPLIPESIGVDIMGILVEASPPLMTANIRYIANLSLNFMLRKSRMLNTTLTTIIAENHINKQLLHPPQRT